jgi:hypothetical protein
LHIALTIIYKKLGGKWDAQAKAWIFSTIVEKEVEDLDFIWSSEKRFYEIEFPDGFQSYQDTITVYGYVLAKATGRDSGARVENGFATIAGGFSSGGSFKNWYTTAKPGTKIRIELPIEVVKTYKGRDGMILTELKTEIEDKQND